MARPRLIDRDAILAAGLAVASDVGVDRLTMQAVARRLGVTPMALYRHVTDKADLLDGLVERLIAEVEPPDPAGEPIDQLAAIGRALRGVAQRHPTVFPLLLQRPATTPASRHARDRIVDLLRCAGVPEDQLARCERVVSTFIIGFAASEASPRFGHHPPTELDADHRLIETTIAHLVDSLASGDGS